MLGILNSRQRECGSNSGKRKMPDCEHKPPYLYKQGYLTCTQCRTALAYPVDYPQRMKAAERRLLKEFAPSTLTFVDATTSPQGYKLT